MPIDASIYGQIRAPEQVNPLAQYAQVAQIKNMQTQGRLADLAYGEKEREVTENRNVNDAYREAMGPDGRTDRSALIRGLIQRGAGSRTPGIQKSFTDADKSQGEVDKQKVDLIDAKLKQSRQFLETITTPEQYIAWHEGNHKDPILGPALAARGVTADQARATIVAALSKPGGFEELLKKSALGIEKFTEANKPTTSVLNNGAENQVIQTPGLGGTPQTVMTAPITLSASAKNADDRARDFNQTKVEENRLKREAKEETATLTKNSQIASFDTMLGTLDRLSKHPGLARSVGVVGALPTMPGSDSANFQAELNTFQSQAFIPMVAQLKGMGALSDAEGKKLTQAVGALDPKMGEQAFRDSVARITADMEAARQRMVGGEKVPAGGAGGAAGGWDASKPATVSNAADYAKIPSGAIYTSPDGKMRRKP